MTEDLNDYETDIQFGHWLRERRVSAGLSLEDAAKNSGLAPERLKALELGFAERGITRLESERLCDIYHVGLEELIDRASSG